MWTSDLYFLTCPLDPNNGDDGIRRRDNDPIRVCPEHEVGYFLANTWADQSQPCLMPPCLGVRRAKELQQEAMSTSNKKVDVLKKPKPKVKHAVKTQTNGVILTTNLLSMLDDHGGELQVPC